MIASPTLTSCVTAIMPSSFLASYCIFDMLGCFHARLAKTRGSCLGIHSAVANKTQDDRIDYDLDYDYDFAMHYHHTWQKRWRRYEQSCTSNSQWRTCVDARTAIQTL